MALLSGFTNSFTCGEICPEAWDRDDIQPDAKGCALAQNLIVRIQGPLAKRRGFWLNGPVADQTTTARMVPFRRSVNDALMLSFQNLIAYVWQANGSPLMNGGQQVSFSTPYTTADLAGLRWKQVSDVIYFRHSSGAIQPYSLERLSDTSWQFSSTANPNGPWLNENTDIGSTITVGGGAPVGDANTTTGAAYMPVGSAVTLTASDPIFNANQVGSYIRLRQAPGEGAGVYSWAAGYTKPLGWFCLSVGNLYVCTASPGKQQDADVTNPPVHTQGTASDGAATWQYIGDGAGIIAITGFTSATEVTGTVDAALPIGNYATSYWAFHAYSNDQGWPRMWPAMREERLVGGATTANLDIIDLTRTSGFYPTRMDFHPGQGTGNVLATDGIRRRVGDDFGELIWSTVSTYLLVGSVSGEYLVAGSVLDEPLSPMAIVIKQLSAYGSADAAPVRAHKGVLYITRANQQVRELVVDTSQQASTDDLTVLATHIATRNFEQLAWVLAPDETLFARMGDGSMAAMVYHAEQGVRGWCSMTLPPATIAGTTAWICEDIQTLPGPGGFETLWTTWSRTKGGQSQRVMLMQSQRTDGLFMDLAQSYSGAPVSQIGSLEMFAGETVTVVANGAQLPDVVVSGGGAVPVPAGTTQAQVGFRYTAMFESLPLSLQGEIGGTLGKRQRAVGATVSLYGTVCQVGLLGGVLETVDTRLQSDIPNIVPKPWRKNVTFAGDSGLNGYDPRIVVEDSTAYDFLLKSIRPKAVVGD